MSDETKDYLTKFWELNDEILNAILFLFMGFELLLIPDLKLNTYSIVSAMAIVVVLFARFLSIWLPSLIVPFKLNKGSLTMLVWGGLRGGVSIALVLAIGANPYKDLLLQMTYFVVVFSIIFQGLTLGKMSGKVLNRVVSN